MGRATKQTVGKSPAKGTPPTKSQGQTHTGSPDSENENAALQLVESIEDFKAKLQGLLELATEVQAAPLPSKLESIQALLENHQLVLGEKLTLQEQLERKDQEIELWKTNVTTLQLQRKQEEIKYQQTLDEMRREQDQAKAENEQHRVDIQNLIQRHENNKIVHERQMKVEMDAKMSALELEHREKLSALEAQLSECQQELSESLEAFEHSKSQNTCITLEKQKLERDMKRMEREYVYVRERFDRLLYKDDDLNLAFEFDQLAQQVIRFVMRYAKMFGGHNFDREKDKLPKNLSTSDFIPITRTPCSKSLRVAWAVSYISKSFINYLFQPFGQCMNNEDKKRIEQFQNYSYMLAAKDPTKEAIWRNLTLQAMRDSGEYSFLNATCTDPHITQHKQERDTARERVFKIELETLWPVLNTPPDQFEEMKIEFDRLIRNAAEVWIRARRNWEPVEASEEVIWSPTSDWDHTHIEYIDHETERDRNGVSIAVDGRSNASPTIDSMCHANPETILTIDGGENLCAMRLCLFPKILRVSHGSPRVLYEGIALFEGGALYSQGEEEVAEERLREIEQQKLRRKRHFGYSQTRRNSINNSTSSHKGIQSQHEQIPDSSRGQMDLMQELSSSLTSESTSTTASGEDRLVVSHEDDNIQGLEKEIEVTIVDTVEGSSDGVENKSD